MTALVRFKAVKSLRNKLAHFRKDTLSIGFVPTLGALHEGHLSLIRKASLSTDRTICSIFVNPTQFNSSEDLKKYPRTYRRDRQMVEKTNCHILFTPWLKEIYPEQGIEKLSIDLAGLDTTMEGKFRPGHFQGVVQVVKRLLDIVEPDQLFMGQKDFQQLAVIQHLLKISKLPVKLVACPTLRENSGLAMSSRNERLSKDNRREAAIIYDTLCFAKEKIQNQQVGVIEQEALVRLTKGEFRPEYFSIVDAFTLQKVDDVRNHKKTIACTAVWANQVRLIDNMIMT